MESVNSTKDWKDKLASIFEANMKLFMYVNPRPQALSISYAGRLKFIIQLRKQTLVWTEFCDFSDSIPIIKIPLHKFYLEKTKKNLRTKTRLP